MTPSQKKALDSFISDELSQYNDGEIKEIKTETTDSGVLYVSLVTGATDDDTNAMVLCRNYCAARIGRRGAVRIVARSR